MRLIDADALKNAIWAESWKEDTTVKMAVEYINILIDEQPTINPADLRPRGRWIQYNKENNNWVECSECNTVGSPLWKCCPVCTAMMEGKHEDI